MQPIGPERPHDLDDYLELLAVIGEDFARSLDITATLKKALARIMNYLDAEGASVFMLENDESELVCRVCVGPSDITGFRLAFGEGIVSQSIEDNRCLMIREPRADPRFASRVDDRTGFVTKSILCAPLSVKGKRFGAMELINKRNADGRFDERDRQALQALASSAAMAINNARMTKALVDQERLQRELELAAELQASLLPARRPEPFPVTAINLPARTVSGDFFDYFDLWDGRICFNLGDVSGKGINAALLMAKTASLYRCLGKTIHEPGKLLGLINREICETVTRGMFVTMVAGLYDPRSGVIRLANAGHEPPLLQTRKGAFHDFPAEAPPLGIAPDLFANARVPEIEIRLDDGALYIFSDGVTEGRINGGDELGVEGLKALLARFADKPIGRRLDAVVAEFGKAGQPLHDDLTIMVIENQSPPDRA